METSRGLFDPSRELQVVPLPACCTVARVYVVFWKFRSIASPSAVVSSGGAFDFSVYLVVTAPGVGTYERLTHCDRYQMGGFPIESSEILVLMFADDAEA